jgi:hypothetical protein
MSIADHFEQIPDAGFVRTYDSGSARRQFNVSLLLIVSIAVAASALAFIVRFDRPATAAMTDSTAATPAYAGTLTR